jgi:adenine-specific DNA-methyltransferase
VIKYLGSKRRLIALIETAVLSAGDVDVVVDLFSGTSRVGQALKRRGLRVKANDHNAYAHTLARCYVEADAAAVVDDVTCLIAELNALPGKAGWFTETYCERSRFFQPKNGAKIDVIRDAIAKKALDPVLEAVLLTSLMEAADRVDSTVGVQMAYLKSWAKRAHNDLEMRVPELIPATSKGPCSAHRLDATEAASALSGDVVYLDPPYNVHSYLSNYHIWETLIAWDRPEVYGVACKRVDCRERKSRFNSRGQFKAALHGVIARLNARALVVSFSDEGYVTKDEMVAMLSTRGPVSVVEQSGFQRYVGARIGIYNPSGEKVGAISHTENTEYVFVVTVETPALPS